MTTTARKQQYLAIDVANLEAALTDLVAAFPELADDEDLRRDTIEGETDAFSLLARLVNQEREANSMAAAIKARIDDLSARKQRAERRKEAMRSLMFKVMKAGSLPKVQLPEATLSIGKKAAAVEIVDESALPKWAVRVSYSPDKAAIKERLAAGKKVKGARMGEVGEQLSVRVA